MQVSLSDDAMVPLLPSRPLRPMAVAYDSLNQRVYWTDVRQRTISSYQLPLLNNYNNNSRPTITTVYHDSDGLSSTRVVAMNFIGGGYKF